MANPILINNTFGVLDMNFDALEENPIWTPIDAPYWDDVGNVKDQTNTHEAIHHKYVSFLHIHSIQHSTALNRSGRRGLQASYNAPETALYQFGPTVRLSVPPNWVECSNIFLVNCDASGFDTATNNEGFFKYDEPEEDRLFSYPHAAYAPVGWEPYTIVGNVTEEMDGYSEYTLPSWFKF